MPMSCISLKVERVSDFDVSISQVCSPSYVLNYLFAANALLVDKDNNRFLVK